MFERIKENIFTVHGLLTTVIHVFLAVGFVTSWVVVQVHILGNDPVAALQSSSTSSAKKR